MYLKKYCSINELPEGINCLFDINEKTSLFLSKNWFYLYEKYFLNIHKNHFIIVFDTQDQALVLLLLMAENNNFFSVSNFYTAFYAPLIRPELTKATLTQAYSLIINDYLFANNIHSIQLSPLALDSTENTLFIAALKKHQFIIDISFYCANWTEDVSHTNFQQYFQQRPSILKNTIKRKTNKLKKNGSHSINIYTDIKDIRSHIVEYKRIYKLSWKTEEASIEFIEDFINNYAESGNTRLGIAVINGQAVASQFWLVHNDTALIYKLAYDPAYKAYSIGSILTAKMMEYVIDIDGVKNIDYLTGDDTYKKDWMSHRQELSSITAYNSHTINGFFRGTAILLKAMIKKQLNKLHH